MRCDRRTGAALHILRFAYTIDGNKLMIDYANESVRDSEYEFTVDGNTLTLIGGEGTVGRTYELSGVCVTRCPPMMILRRNMIIV